MGSDSSDTPETADNPENLRVASAREESLRVASLGSGSAGNSTLVCTATTRVLVDCGFTLKETLVRLAALGVEPEDIDAILVTHEHGDHVRGLGPLARKFGTPVWITHGTFGAWRDKKISQVNFCTAHETFLIGDISVEPFPTPHDAAESCQYVFSAHGVSFATVTDLGICTPHIKEKISALNAMLIECNYDIEMLRVGPYPASLRARIQSQFGHLGNQQAADLLEQIDHPELQTILLGHLSENNNTPEQAYRTVAEKVPDNGRIHVLAQHESSRWFTISAHNVPDANAVSAGPVATRIIA